MTTDLPHNNPLTYVHLRVVSSTACPSCDAPPGQRCESGPTPLTHVARAYQWIVDNDNRLKFAQELAVEKEEDYRMVADKIIELFNPPEDDAAEIHIVIEALKRAQKCLINEVECWCADKAGNPENEDPCDRCAALGRFDDVVLER